MHNCKLAPSPVKVNITCVHIIIYIFNHAIYTRSHAGVLLVAKGIRGVYLVLSTLHIDLIEVPVGRAERQHS